MIWNELIIVVINLLVYKSKESVGAMVAKQFILLWILVGGGIPEAATG